MEMNEKHAFLQIGLSKMGDKKGVDSDEVEVDADKDLLLVRKKIFKSPQYDRIKSLDSEIRRYVRSQGFPFEKGLHLQAAKMMPIINDRLIEFSHTRWIYVLDFGQVWPNIVEEFPEKLRKLYNRDDYEDGDVTKNFSMYWNWLALDVPKSLEFMSPHIIREEQNKLRHRIEEAYEGARMILRETCLALVTTLRESLAGDEYGAPKRISTSTVNKLHEFLNTFNLRDITDDSELQRIVDQTRMILGNCDAGFLRDSAHFRYNIHEQLSGIVHNLQEAVTVAPARRIRRSNVNEQADVQTSDS